MTITTATTTATTNRTIVRAKRAAKLTTMRAAFKVLDRVAPDLAARWALNIWCTVPQSARGRFDARPYGGRLNTVEVPAGGHVVTETWGEGPPIYLAHGWHGWRGQLGRFVEPLVKAGYEATAFDAPSHGDSSPGMLGRRKATGVDFVNALVAVATTYGTPAAVIAHSLGAAALSGSPFPGDREDYPTRGRSTSCSR